MYDIPLHRPSPEFETCWRAAGQHIAQQGQGAVNWLRAHLNPPMLEHLSFRLGNQLFFICIDAEGVLPLADNTVKGLRRLAEGSRGHACIMPMRRMPVDWKPVLAGWGLMDLASRRIITPPELVTDEKIEMTDWELQDFAVRVVKV